MVATANFPRRSSCNRNDHGVEPSIEEVGLKVKTAEKIKKLIFKILTKKHFKMEFQAKKLLDYMSSDKKKVGNSLNFILLSEIGRPKVVSDIDSLKVMNSMIIS